MNELFTAAAATAAPAEILATELPLGEISRSDSKARAMEARHRLSNVIALRRLRAATRRHMDGKGDFSRFSKNYLANGTPGKRCTVPVVIYAKNYALFV